MEENNIMNNEEVIELLPATEEIVEATSNGGFKTATTIGLAMIAGGLICKFVVEPSVRKIKLWNRNRKSERCEVVDDTWEDDDIVEVGNSEESEE
jgi:hypothetical protein